MTITFNTATIPLTNFKAGEAVRPHIRPRTVCFVAGTATGYLRRRFEEVLVRLSAIPAAGAWGS
jgi:hypothetical protein